MALPLYSYILTISILVSWQSTNRFVWPPNVLDILLTKVDQRITTIVTRIQNTGAAIKILHIYSSINFGVRK